MEEKIGKPTEEEKLKVLTADLIKYKQNLANIDSEQDIIKFFDFLDSKLKDFIKDDQFLFTIDSKYLVNLPCKPTYLQLPAIRSLGSKGSNIENHIADFLQVNIVKDFIIINDQKLITAEGQAFLVSIFNDCYYEFINIIEIYVLFFYSQYLSGQIKKKTNFQN